MDAKGRDRELPLGSREPPPRGCPISQPEAHPAAPCSLSLWSSIHRAALTGPLSFLLIAHFLDFLHLLFPIYPRICMNCSSNSHIQKHHTAMFPYLIKSLVLPLLVREASYPVQSLLEASVPESGPSPKYSGLGRRLQLFRPLWSHWSMLFSPYGLFQGRSPFSRGTHVGWAPFSVSIKATAPVFRLQHPRASYETSWTVNRSAGGPPNFSTYCSSLFFWFLVIFTTYSQSQLHLFV